jgi:pyruvate kinase
MAKILCTIGPSSLNARVIQRLENLGASLFRINLSHTRLEDVERVVTTIQRHTRVPVCLDTEGAQIRTAALVDGTVTLRENTMVAVHSRLVPGDPYNIAFYPPETVAQFQPGDFVSIDFNSVMTQVVEVLPDRAIVRVINGGEVGSNKAVTVHSPIAMPALTAKDKGALEIGRRLGIRHVALSFANSPEDVDEIRAHTNEGTFVISKIECRNGLDRLEAIALKSDAILIDRGDLSREIPIERIPSAQKHIIRTAKKLAREVYVATNLLETMVSTPLPTRAEVNDIFNTLQDGADGLVMAAETAIGKFPINCAAMVVKLIHEFETPAALTAVGESFSLLPDAHGGRLNLATADAAMLSESDGLPTLTVPETVLRDAEQIATGVYSPVDGFMGKEMLDAVLTDNRLPGGPAWTMPIVFPLPAGAGRLSPGQRVALATTAKTVHSIMDVTEVFDVDLSDLASRWFGTTSTDHPGVARLMKGGNRFAGGRVWLAERLPSPSRSYDLSPHQCRFVFAQKGWSRVVAFHGRNVPHRAHEYIQLKALETTFADGLFISPVVGPRKSGDFLPAAIVKSYETLINFGFYPRGNVALGTFNSYPRYSGPREAVFTALCRKNMGCSHFIIGRDHAGVGDFYAPDANRRLFDALGDIGIEPVFFDPIGYDVAGGRYVSTLECPEAQNISGTEVRQTLSAGRHLPDWAIRPVVQDVLLAELAAGREIFC